MNNKHRYPVEWYDILRPEALKRASYKCSNCGVKHRSIGYRDTFKAFIECDEFMVAWAIKQGFKIVKIFLQISHDNNDVTDNRPCNLIARCARCHLIHDKKFNTIRRNSSIK